MLTALTSMPFPELTAWLLAGAIPLALTALGWPLIRPRHRPAVGSELNVDQIVQEHSRHIGLPGQWVRHCRRVESRIEGQRSALSLHREAAMRLGALDYEIDRLWRETRALLNGNSRAY
jgi:hypothetical protein